MEWAKKNWKALIAGIGATLVALGIAFGEKLCDFAGIDCKAKTEQVQSVSE